MRLRIGFMFRRRSWQSCFQSNFAQGALRDLRFQIRDSKSKTKNQEPRTKNQRPKTKNMTDTTEVGNQLRLDLLREALPYIQRFKGKTFVVKFSGKVTEDHDRLMSLAEELALLHQVGIRLCVVHGGGKQLSELAALMGVEQTIIEGRRVTDAPTSEMAKMNFSCKSNTTVRGAP